MDATAGLDRISYPGPDATPASRRRDRNAYLSLRAAYTPMSWLVVTPYYQVQSRDSNAGGLDFDANSLGVNFALRVQR